MKKKKEVKKILVFIDWFVPGYKAGGPIQSVVNLINQLQGEYEFYVVTSNSDLGEPKPYENIDYNCWITSEKYSVIYLDRKNQNIRKYKALLEERNYDYVYFNSLFSINFTLKPLILARKSDIKIVLAPRGMLGNGALQLKKRKKQIFLSLFKISGISKKIIWHATANSEASEIKKQFSENICVKIATNLSAVIPERLGFKKKEENRLNLFFLSRISKKKNLKAALQFFLDIKSKYQIVFTIIGPIEDLDYWRSCEKVIEKMPSNVTVEFLGAVPNYQLNQILKDQHFMLLPTFNENFGHVIMESWQNGCPVIISDQTPWENLFHKKLGFDLSLKLPKSFIEAIENAAAMPEPEYREWSIASFKFAKERSQDPNTIKSYKELFV